MRTSYHTYPQASCCLLAHLAGGGFELVSCPHYLGEVVIYAGLVLVQAWCRATTWLMLLWVVSLQAVPAALPLDCPCQPHAHLVAAYHPLS